MTYTRPLLRARFYQQLNSPPWEISPGGVRVATGGPPPTCCVSSAGPPRSFNSWGLRQPWYNDRDDQLRSIFVSEFFCASMGLGAGLGGGPWHSPPPNRTWGAKKAILQDVSRACTRFKLLLYASENPSNEKLNLRLRNYMYKKASLVSTLKPLTTAPPSSRTSWSGFTVIASATAGQGCHGFRDDRQQVKEKDQSVMSCVSSAKKDAAEPLAECVPVRGACPLPAPGAGQGLNNFPFGAVLASLRLIPFNFYKPRSRQVKAVWSWKRTCGGLSTNQ